MDRSFADVDPVPVVFAHLKAHPRVLAEFGSADHLTGIREDPWPHLEVTAGDSGSLARIEMGSIDATVDFTVWGHPDGRHGPSALRRLCFVVIEACLELAHNAHTPGQPVISTVSFDGHPTKQDLASGQRRWMFSGTFTMTPPTEVAP